MVFDCDISSSYSLAFSDTTVKVYKQRILHECSSFIEFIKQVGEKR